MAKEFNAKLGPLVVNLEWRLTLFALILIPLMTKLGFWQLERAEEKRVLASRHAAQTALPALTLDELLMQIAPVKPRELSDESADVVQERARPADMASMADRSVSFTGQFSADRYLLLDNRIQNGRFGYEVIALVSSQDVLVPVNLGWVAGDPARRTLPTVRLAAGKQQRVAGRIFIPQGAAYLLEAQTAPTTFPTVIQDYPAVEMAPALAALTSQPVMPFLVHIDPASPLAESAVWVLMNQSPEKHTGYAVQWFTMAAVLLLAFLLRSSNLYALLRPKTSPNDKLI